MMFHFSFGGPPANGFFEQMAVQASTLKHPRSRMRQGQAEETKRLQREMDMNTNAEDFFFFFVSTRHVICMQQRGSMDSAVCTDTQCCGVVLFRVNMFQTILIVLQNLWSTLGLPPPPHPPTHSPAT